MVTTQKDLVKLRLTAPGRPAAVGPAHPPRVGAGKDRTRLHRDPLTRRRERLRHDEAEPQERRLSNPMKPFDLHGLKTYDLQSRPSKVFARGPGPAAVGLGGTSATGSTACRGSWPAIDLRRVRDHLCRAHGEGRTVVAALGGHVIKTGCGPYLIDWIQQGLLKAVALNGAAAIHDFELALAGKTSEDVGASLPTGQFGMARETADAFAVAARDGAENGHRPGRGPGPAIMDELDCPHADSSLVLAAYRAGIPCTVHVALGTDIVHMHPHVSGAALGEASLIDFRRLCSVVADHGARRLAEPGQRRHAARGAAQGGQRGAQLRPQPRRPGHGQRGQGIALPQHGQRARAGRRPRASS